MTVEFSIATALAGTKKLPGPLFAAFKEAGFSAVHWSQDWCGEPLFYSEDFARQVHQLAVHNGLRVADVHGYGGTYSDITYTPELFVAANINRAEFAARVGASTVVLHLPVGREEPSPAAVESSIAMLRAIQPAFAGLGIRAAVENLTWKSHTGEFIAALLDAFDRDFLGFCYDAGHAVLTGQSQLLVRHIDRLIATHLHDNDGSADQHRLPGQGLANWPEIISILKNSAYLGTVNMELHLPAGNDLTTFCRQAHNLLTTMWLQIP